MYIVPFVEMMSRHWETLGCSDRCRFRDTGQWFHSSCSLDKGQCHRRSSWSQVNLAEAYEENSEVSALPAALGA